MTPRFGTAAAGLPRSCAAPAGGASSEGRGRLGSGAALATSLLVVACPSHAEGLDTPSGRVVTALEYLADEDAQGAVLRARYHAPELSGAVEIDGVFADMAHLCETDALPHLAAMETAPPRIIVSLSAAPLAFGETAPDVVQYFEAYRIESGRCVWELF